MKNQIILRFFLVCLVAFGTTSYSFGQTSRTDSIRHMFKDEPKTILIAAHRGTHILLPENSLASMDQAIKDGAHVVEIDARLTKDSVFVNLHDQTVDRVTTGKGKVSDLTYAEIQKLYLTHKGEKTEYRVRTVKESLLQAKGKVLIDIDFKVFSENNAAACYKLIKELDMEKDVLFFLNHYESIPFLQSLNPNITLMPKANSKKDLENILKYPNIRIIHIEEDFYDDATMKKVLDSGIRIWANSLGKYDYTEGYQKMFENMKYINVVQTDFSKKLGDFLKSNQSR